MSDRLSAEELDAAEYLAPVSESEALICLLVAEVRASWAERDRALDEYRRTAAALDSTCRREEAERDALQALRTARGTATKEET